MSLTKERAEKLSKVLSSYSVADFIKNSEVALDPKVRHHLMITYREKGELDVSPENLMALYKKFKV